MTGSGTVTAADGLPPGSKVFRSDREFLLWAFTVSHGQMLLRSPMRDEFQTRVDVLFKPVEVIKMRASYDGLAIRCATDDQKQQIREQWDVDLRADALFLILDTTGGSDHVVCSAVSWCEDIGDDRGPSRLGMWPPGSDPARILD